MDQPFTLAVANCPTDIIAPPPTEAELICCNPSICYCIEGTNVPIIQRYLREYSDGTTQEMFEYIPAAIWDTTSTTAAGTPGYPGPGRFTVLPSQVYVNGVAMNIEPCAKSSDLELPPIYTQTDLKIDTEASPYCGQLIYHCSDNPGVKFVYDKTLCTFLEFNEMGIALGAVSTKEENCTYDRERFVLCFDNAGSPVDAAGIEAAIAAAGKTWDNGDAVAAIAGDNAKIVSAEYDVFKCGNKKPDGTIIGWDGEDDGSLCAVEVSDASGPIAMINGGGGDAMTGSYATPVEFDLSMVVNQSAAGSTAGLQVCVTIERKYDAAGNVVAI